MPKCKMEELGGYAPLTNEEINGDEPLAIQPLWRVSWINKHNAAILEYANALRAYRIDKTFCLVKRWYTWPQYELIHLNNIPIT